MTRPFADRAEAGEKLAARLAHLGGQDVVVLALPRGGVPVAWPVARALGAPLDLVLVRKIGAPGFEEFAVGAIAEGDPPEVVRDERSLAAMGADEAWFASAVARAAEEMARRRAVFLRGRTRPEITGRVAVLVDDGLATGATMRAAARATRRRKPARLVIAVPVGAPDAVQRCAAEADEVVCLRAPEDFRAVGQHYRRFPQLTDAEVTAVLDAAAGRRGGG
jgi:putative phosphoribosyl transferase